MFNKLNSETKKTKKKNFTNLISMTYFLQRKKIHINYKSLHNILITESGSLLSFKN